MDALRGVPLALLCLLPLVAYMSASPTGRPPLNVPVYLGLSLALLLPLLSRRSPPAVFAVVSLISFGQWLAEAQVLPANVAVLVALWSVAYRASFRWALAARLVARAGGVPGPGAVGHALARHVLQRLDLRRRRSG